MSRVGRRPIRSPRCPKTIGADRADDEAGRDGEEARERAAERAERLEEERADEERGEVREEVEVVRLERRADERGDGDASCGARRDAGAIGGAAREGAVELTHGPCQFGAPDRDSTRARPTIKRRCRRSVHDPGRIVSTDVDPAITGESSEERRRSRRATRTERDWPVTAEEERSHPATTADAASGVVPRRARRASWRPRADERPARREMPYPKSPESRSPTRSAGRVSDSEPELPGDRERGARRSGRRTAPSAHPSTTARMRRSGSSTTARRSPTACRTTATC